MLKLGEYRDPGQSEMQASVGWEAMERAKRPYSIQKRASAKKNHHIGNGK
jgi:hypothetical protein